MINPINYPHNEQLFGTAPAVKEDASFDDFLANSLTEKSKERTGGWKWKCNRSQADLVFSGGSSVLAAMRYLNFC